MPRPHSRAAVVLIAFAVVAAMPVLAAPDPGAAAPVVVIRIDDLITAGTADYVVEELRRAARDEAAAVVIQLDTPGGLVDATLDILQAVSTSPVPVITWVGPQGSIAASAGSFILVSGHVAAMAPGTTTGAAMPVAVDPAGGAPQPADEKTINFLAGHLRSLARTRGRPPELVERFVTENLTLEADEAHDYGVVDIIAADVYDLLNQAHGRKVEVAQRGEIRLTTRGAPVRETTMSLQRRFQHLISNPQLAFLLLVGGAYGLYIGLASPGTVLPETLGAILVLLGIYGLGLFETSLTGLLLILLGLGFLIAEAFAATHGILAAAGVVSLALGALLLPREPLLPEPWFYAFRNTVAGVALGAGILTLTVVTAVVRSRRRRAREGPLVDFPRHGQATTDLAPEGWVRLGGELWRARAEGGAAVRAGDRVDVIAREGLVVIVRPAGGGEGRPPADTREGGGTAK